VLVHELFKVRLPVAGHISRCYLLIRRNAETGMQRVTNCEGKSSAIEENARKSLLSTVQRLRRGVACCGSRIGIAVQSPVLGHYNGLLWRMT
jgi:hypothetical protein